jgi:hypothetical protein
VPRGATVMTGSHAAPSSYASAAAGVCAGAVADSGTQHAKKTVALAK